MLTVIRTLKCLFFAGVWPSLPKHLLQVIMQKQIGPTDTQNSYCPKRVWGQDALNKVLFRKSWFLICLWPPFVQGAMLWIYGRLRPLCMHIFFQVKNFSVKKCVVWRAAFITLSPSLSLYHKLQWIRLFMICIDCK